MISLIRRGQEGVYGIALIYPTLSLSLSQSYVKMLKSSSVFETEHNTQPLQYLICATRCSVITDRGLHIPKFNQEQ